MLIGEKIQELELRIRDLEAQEMRRKWDRLDQLLMVVMVINALLMVLQRMGI